ncbi:MAG: diguanylate cyclase domain-containing protein [Pseudonocardiaceae bacterium]
MSDPVQPQGMAELARRWSDTLTSSGVTLPREELERLITGIARDVSTSTEQARVAAGQRFTTLYASAPLGIALTDEHGVIVEANPAIGTTLGYSPESLRGKAVTDLASENSDAEALRGGLAGLRDSGGSQQGLQLSLEHAVDGPLRAKVTMTYLPADTPGEAYPVVMVQDINELHLLREALRRQNVHDPLTGLPNSQSFDTQLERAIADHSHRQVALVYFDLDGFRVINDGLGARVGDELLRAVADKLRSAFAGPNALVARLTGDGFGVLLQGELTPTGVIDRVRGTMDELSEPIYVGDHAVGVNASAGIVVRDVGDGTAADMERAAQITLHRAKEKGRAQWMLFDPDDDARDRGRYRMGAQIAGALENGEFELVYQPTVKLDGSGHLPVVNATLRWNHPDGGQFDIDDVMPLADATGMTLPLGRWLLAEGLSARAGWESTESGPVPDLCLRLPTRMAIDDDLVGMVKRELESNQLSSASLRLCADGSTILDPRGEVLDSLSVLGDLGVQLVLAVSGAADLELIHRHKLRVGYVVLTGRIVDALLDPEGEFPATMRHLEHLIESAKELGVRIGAEGVRTADQADRLAQLGVIAARGAFFRDSASAEDITSMIADRAANPPRSASSAGRAR